MKKSITLMLLFVMAISANAGLVLQTKGSLYVCPKVFNTSGKSVVYSRDEGVITIYTPDFLVDKTIIPPVQEYLSGGFTEEATVKATGVNVVPSVVYYDDLVSNNYYSNLCFDASSQEDMITKLNENYGNYYMFTAFTDPLGNPACYSDYYASFKYANLFGKQYPEEWYALIDGGVYRIYTYDSFYQLAYDEKSAVWTRTSENIYTVSSHTIYDFEVYYEGMTRSVYGDDIYITQNLFNNDDKWEYLVADYSGPSQISYDTPQVTVNEDGTVTLKRNGNVFPEGRGYAVYNEDGEKLGNIPGGRIYVINGKPYVYSNSSLYSFDKEGGDIDLIETVRVKGARRLDAMKGIVTVDINAEQAGGEVVVSTPDGKVMANKKVGIGQTQINSQPLPAGIYVVSLLKGGRVVESEKYLVK